MSARNKSARFFPEPCGCVSKTRLTDRHVCRALVLAAAVFLAAGTACADVGGRFVARTDELAARDPATGILIGAEPFDIGPENAPGAILFIHGFLGAGQNFADVPHRLAEKGWRVRVMLLPGHGTSPKDLEEVTADMLLEAVLGELAGLRERHRRVVVVGHSMGGTLAVLAAARVPVDQLVLAAPYFGVTRHWYYVLPPERWAKLGRPFFRWLYKGKLFAQVNRPEAKDEILSYAWAPVEAVLTLIKLGKQAQRPEILQHISCPVLWIHSQHDAAASPEQAQRVFDAFPAADKRAVWLEQSNHHVFFDYEREHVAAELIAWIGMPPTDGGPTGAGEN